MTKFDNQRQKALDTFKESDLINNAGNWHIWKRAF
jgi:hypothetical protein